MSNPQQQPEESGGLSRREFVKATAATALLSAPFVHAAGSDTIRVGLVGCGGRGTGAASQALNADQAVILTAMGDMFEDKLTASLKRLSKQEPQRVQVPPEAQFVGFDAYQRVIDSGVDVVILTTTPNFRPLHLRAAVDAGKHVFTEKPMAVDSAGIRSVLRSVEDARQQGLSVVAGFCWSATS
jgi:predicted dehydrogenase